MFPLQAINEAQTPETCKTKQPLSFLSSVLQAIKLSRSVGPLEIQVSPEGPEAVALLQTQRVMLAPVQASTGVNTKAFFGLSIGLPVVSTRAALGGYFPREATGDGNWEAVPEKEFCGKRMTPDDVFFVGATAEEYTEALIEAYTNETVRNDSDTSRFLEKRQRILERDPCILEVSLSI